MDQKLINKIQNILARADADRNDNPHEREIAMRQANALLVKHGLSMTDITDQTERKDTLGALGRTQETLGSRYVWEAGVWSAVAKLNACQVIRTPRRTGRIQISLIGRQLNCTVTKQIAAYVVASIKREAKAQGFSSVAFGVGAWTGVSDQVDELLEARKRNVLDNEVVPESTAMMVIDQHKQSLAETNKATKEFFPRIRSGSYGYNGDRAGTSEGRAYGRKVGLNNQLGGAGQRRIGN